MPLQPANKPIIIGRIGGPHGIKGWLKVTSYTDPPENILNYQPWQIYRNGIWQEIVLSHNQLHSGNVLIQIKDYTDRDKARIFTGMEIAAERTQLPSLPKGEYYWTDLEGLTVVTTNNRVLGRVDHVFSTGSNDVLSVIGDKKRLIPFLLNNVIIAIDLDTKTIQVDWDPEF